MGAILARRRRVAAAAVAVAALSALVVAGCLAGDLLGGPAELVYGTVLGGVVAVVAGIYALCMAGDVRRFEGELADMLDAGVGRPTTAAAGVLELGGRHEGHATMSWNGAVVGTVTEPGVVWAEEPRPGDPAWARGVAGDVLGWLRLRLDGRPYVLEGRRTLIDDQGRCWPVPCAAEIRSGAPLRVELPGELPPLGAVLVLSGLLWFQQASDAARAAASSS